MIEFQEINEKFKTFQKIGAYILTSLNYFFTPMSKIWKKVLLLDPVPLFVSENPDSIRYAHGIRIFTNSGWNINPYNTPR